MNPFRTYSILKNIRVLFWLYFIVTVIASLHRYFLGIDHINNFIIFKTSFTHLIANKDLYIPYPERYNDLFKYSPAFAFFMGAFAYLPDILGIVLWNLLNSMLLFFAIQQLPGLPDAKKGFVSVFIFIELLTSMQNSQSNGLIAGLLILSFVSFERRNIFLAALFISLSFYIKIFGLAAALLFLLYPHKWKFMGYFVICCLVLFACPLLVISVHQLVFLYKSWFHLLANDPSHSLNFSIMNFVEACFKIQVNDKYVQLAGLGLLLIPLCNIKFYSVFKFRLLLLSAVLIWIIIFNHKAESPTFVIAMLGVALWYVAELPLNINKVLVILAFILTSLSSTDLFPKFIRTTYITPYALKVFPCILIWFKIQYDLIFFKQEHPQLSV